MCVTLFPPLLPMCPVQATFTLSKQGHVVFTCSRKYSNCQVAFITALSGKCYMMLFLRCKLAKNANRQKKSKILSFILIFADNYTKNIKKNKQ